MKKIFTLILTIFFSLNIFAFQLDKSFPLSKNDFDDSIITDQLIAFKFFKDQGYILFDTKEFISADIYINGSKLDLSKVAKKKDLKIDISKLTIDGTNTLQINNLKGKINIKIPYPIVLENKNVEYNTETIKFLKEFIQAEVKAGLPSAQVAVIKDGKLAFTISDGYVNNYMPDGTVLKNKVKVNDTTMYDLASNTKMYATNYAIMKLQSEGKLNVDDYVSKYFPEFTGGGKEKVQVSDLLKHQAGFPADPHFFDTKNEFYAIGKDKVLKAIYKVPLEYEPKTNTKYSDVDYMLLGLLVEKVSGMDLDKYLEKNYYKPLGLKRTMFNPLKHNIPKNEIAATELNGNTRDLSVDFENARKYTVQGEVHDEKAFYSMHGVSGHAGLFSNAKELSKLAQVMINGGGYGDIKFFDKTTLDKFIKPKDINSSYGLGWRRQGDYIYRWAFSSLASRETIGHTGWTGTLTVIDEKQNLVMVLLTNAKNSRVIDTKKNPNDFYGNHYYTSNYGSITTLVMDAFLNKNEAGTAQRMNDILYNLITEKYRLITTDKHYNTSADKNDVKELINLYETRQAKLDDVLTNIKNALK